MKRRVLIALLFVAVVAVLSGCGAMDPASNPIDPTNSWIDRYFVNPMSFLLDWFAVQFGNSYGLSLAAVTLLVRLVILPLTLKQYKSSKAMQSLQPELKKLKDKYKDDPKKQQEETMKLFQQNNVNPMAGCFPVLVQMPVLIALYNAIMRNPNIREHSFLWLELGKADPFFILPILAAITTFLQQKMMSSQMNAQMQMMLFIFPVLIFVMSLQFASALSLYWVYGNLFTIIQSYFIYVRPQSKEKLEIAAPAPKKKK
ncbi:membrane protein insertase YidC [Paenibacillus sp. y28]|uniref:membrane protein insertase YidC n=1 Tax=Paenibacillus sp. y28 TaxID=3129110 RepID=UPI0030169636